MNISAKVDEVFGNQLATLFAAEISDEDLLATARKAYNELNTKGPYNRDSRFEEILKDKLVKRYVQKIEEFLSLPAVEEEVNQRAKRIISAAHEKAEQILINNLADGMAKSATYNLDVAMLSSALHQNLYELQNHGHI